MWMDKHTDSKKNNNNNFLFLRIWKFVPLQQRNASERNKQIYQNVVYWTKCKHHCEVFTISRGCQRVEHSLWHEWNICRCSGMFKRSIAICKHLKIFFMSYRLWISYLCRIVTVVSWCGRAVASITVALCLSSIMRGTGAHHGKQEWIWSWNGLYICLHWLVCLALFPCCMNLIKQLFALCLLAWLYWSYF